MEVRKDQPPTDEVGEGIGGNIGDRIGAYVRDAIRTEASNTRTWLEGLLATKEITFTLWGITMRVGVEEKHHAG